jgi:hypothetical protein
VWFNGLSNGLIEGSGYADLGELDQLDEEHKLIYEFSQAVSRLRTVGGNVWARDVVIWEFALLVKQDQRERQI